MKVIRRTASSKTDWQRALFIPLTILAWLAVVVIAGWLLSHIVKTILTLVLSAIVAFALTPLVNLFERWLPRGFAIAIAYILGFALILGMGALLVATAATQVTNLVNSLPSYADQIHRLQPQAVHVLKPFGMTNAKFATAEHQVIVYLQNIGTSIAKDSVNIITGVLGTIVDIILVLILSIYLTSNGKRIARWMRRETPNSQERYTVLTIAIVNQVVGGYIRDTLTMAALIGFLVGIGMVIFHVNYAVLLGILAFFMEFVPIVGVLISGAVCVIVALFQGWILAVIVLGYFVVVHVLEGDIIGPRVMGHAVGIHPATALIALVAGTELFGFWGALFGAPLAGLLQAFITAIWKELQGGKAEMVLHDVVEEEVERQMEETKEPGAKPVLK